MGHSLGQGLAAFFGVVIAAFIFPTAAAQSIQDPGTECRVRDFRMQNSSGKFKVIVSLAGVTVKYTKYVPSTRVPGVVEYLAE